MASFLIEVNAGEFQEPFQIVVAEEIDFHGAPALMVPEADFGAETLLEAVLQGGQMGVGGDGAFRGAGLWAGLVLQGGDEGLGLADIEGFFQDAVRGAAAVPRAKPGRE